MNSRVEPSRLSRTERALGRELTVLSPSRWLAAAAFDRTIIVATFALVRAIDHVAIYLLAVVPLGFRQQALGALFHDAAHRLVSRRRWLNDLLGGPLSAWPLGLTLAGYRRYHLVHHRTLGTHRDPENGHRRLLRQWPLPLRWAHVLHFASDLIGGGLPHLVVAGRMTRPVRVRETIGFLAFWMIVIAIAWRVGALWVPALWIASVATTFWSGVRLRIWTEHLGTRGTHRIKMHPLFEAIVMPHAIGLHWEHHLFPGVPFYRLRELRARVPRPEPVWLSDLVRAFRSSRPVASGELAGEGGLGVRVGGAGKGAP